MRHEEGLGRVGGTAAVYCAAILEYLTAEVSFDERNGPYFTHHLHLAIGRYSMQCSREGPDFGTWSRSGPMSKYGLSSPEVV